MGGFTHCSPLGGGTPSSSSSSKMEVALLGLVVRSSSSALRPALIPCIRLCNSATSTGAFSAAHLVAPCVPASFRGIPFWMRSFSISRCARITLNQSGEGPFPTLAFPSYLMGGRSSASIWPWKFMRAMPGRFSSTGTIFVIPLRSSSCPKSGVSSRPPPSTGASLLPWDSARSTARGLKVRSHSSESGFSFCHAFA